MGKAEGQRRLAGLPDSRRDSTSEKQVDKPAQAITRRYDLAMLAWRNAGDDRTAQRLANRLAESWFGCTCEDLASRQPPPESLTALTAGLPCTVRVLKAERQKSPLVTEQGIERLVNAVQDFFSKLRQVPDMPERQKSPATRPILEVKSKP